MKKLLLILLGLQLSLTGRAQIGTGTKSNYSFMSSGVSRNYKVYKPTIYNGSTKVPLVIVLHPGVIQSGDTMNVQMERYSRFDLVADTAGFLICYPNARKGAFGDPNWAFWDHDNSFGWNDVSFLNQMMDNIIQDYNIDTCKIYITGYSTGAYISYSMACESGSRLAAIAPVSGHKNHSYNCNPTNPVPVFHIHGDQDGDAYYYGNLTQDLDSVATVLRIWYNYNNCSSSPIITTLPNTSTTDNSTVTKYYYTPLSSDKEVIHYKVNGGGHGWPGASFAHPSQTGWNNMDIDASVEIWTFFRRHKLCNNSTGGLEELNSNQFITFPNPTTQTISIESDISINKIKLYSLEGKLLLTTTKIKNIDISKLPSGMIIVEIISKNGKTAHKKVYKQ